MTCCVFQDIACATAVMWALEAGFRKFVVEQGSPNLRWLGNLLDGGIMLSVLALKRSDLFIVMLLSAGHQVLEEKHATIC